MKAKLTTISEANFLRQVLALASLMGWRSFHARPAMTRSGHWITALAGDGKGFPDLLLLRGERIVAAELKVGRNTTTREQYLWLDAFREAGAEVFLWRPSDWDSIEQILAREGI